MKLWFHWEIGLAHDESINVFFGEIFHAKTQREDKGAKVFWFRAASAAKQRRGGVVDFLSSKIERNRLNGVSTINPWSSV